MIKTTETKIRKLKRKTPNTPNIPKISEPTKPRTVKLKRFTKPPAKPLRTIKRYIKQRCDFIYPDGHKCKNNAVGKGTLCRKHHGDPIIKENMIPQKYETELIPFASTFNPAVHPLEYIELSRSGMSKVEIAAQMETSVVTLQNWAEKFESFHKASEIGDALHEAWWIERGKGGLDSRNFNTSLFKFLTSNKLGYSDKMETKAQVLNIHGVLLAPDAVSEDEWENEGAEDVIDV